MSVFLHYLANKKGYCYAQFSELSISESKIELNVAMSSYDQFGKRVLD